MNLVFIDTDGLTAGIEATHAEQTALGRSYIGTTYNYRIGRTHLVYGSGASVSANGDAFFRQRVSNPQTIFDSKQLADNQPLFWDDGEVSGGGTATLYNSNQASTTISVTADTAGRRVRQTRRWLNYQPGKSQNVIMTAVMSGNATKRLGQFNDGNGVFFGHDTTFHVGVRTSATGSPVDTLIPQSEWNIDTMDGTGNSGITLDATKTNIYFIDYEWLGVGTIRYGVFYNGTPYYVHAIHNANINTVVYMSTPNLPLRYEVANDGTNTASSLTHICTTVITEGGRQQSGIERGISVGVTPLTTLNDADTYPMIIIRLKSTYLGSLVRFIDFAALCTSTSEYLISVIVNPTYEGTAPTYVSLTNSAIEYALPTNATKATGGTVLFNQLGSDSAQSRAGISRTFDSDLVIGSSIAGTADTLALCVQRLTGTTETFYAAMNFSETN